LSQFESRQATDITLARNSTFSAVRIVEKSQVRAIFLLLYQSRSDTRETSFQRGSPKTMKYLRRSLSDFRASDFQEKSPKNYPFCAARIGSSPEHRNATAKQT
jgi:hypothetical protein